MVRAPLAVNPDTGTLKYTPKGVVAGRGAGTCAGTGPGRRGRKRGHKGAGPGVGASAGTSSARVQFGGGMLLGGGMSGGD